jgi:hypothetical protein
LELTCTPEDSTGALFCNIETQGGTEVGGASRSFRDSKPAIRTSANTPASCDQWHSRVAVVAAVVRIITAVAAVPGGLIGGMMGGLFGRRWSDKLGS